MANPTKSSHKATIILVGSVIIVATLLFLPQLRWCARTEKPLRLALIDKTVGDTTYRGHRGVHWLLNHLRYVDAASGRHFAFDRDYYGFHPLPAQQFRVVPVPKDLRPFDLIYVADTYGVYAGDWFGTSDAGERSRLVYGGLSAEEYQSIADGLHDGNALIAEFNTFASPTSKDVRAKMERLMQVTWTGWAGRYVGDLRRENRDDIAEWIVLHHEGQSAQPWRFTGQGFILVHEGGTVLVLPVGTGVGSGLLSIRVSPQTSSATGMGDGVVSYHWFDVVVPAPQAEVLARFDLDLTAEGRALFARHDIPLSFPAIVRANARYRAFYVAANLGDNPSLPDSWTGSFVSGGKDGRQSAFFRVLFPLLRYVLSATLPRE